LRNEIIDRQNLIPARLEPFGAATRDLAAARFQRRLNRPLKSPALVGLISTNRTGLSGVLVPICAAIRCTVFASVNPTFKRSSQQRYP
jgi:hypothetical protein